MSVVRQQMESKCLCSLINECQPIVKQPVSHNKTSKLYQCIAYIPGYSEKKTITFCILSTFQLSVTANPWPYISSKLNKPLEMVLSFLIAPLSPKD